MRKFMDIVNEVPIAKPGDWLEAPLTLYNISEFMYHHRWHKVGAIKLPNITYEIAKHNSEPSYMVGNLTEDDKPSREDPTVIGKVFAVVLRIDLSIIDSSSTMGYANLYEVEGVAVDEPLQGAGIASAIYKWLIQHKINLLSDYAQYFGARLWAKLSSNSDVTVDVVNFAIKQILDRGVHLHQGKLDADYDKKYSKMDIRFVLRDMT